MSDSKGHALSRSLVVEVARQRLLVVREGLVARGRTSGGRGDLVLLLGGVVRGGLDLLEALLALLVGNLKLLLKVVLELLD